tara:strand:- start:723 stop:950 length:228 start_codon:yes stop_codon:yes gene_type:complete
MRKRKRYRTDGQYEGTSKIETRTEAKTSRTEAKANLILAKSEKAKQTAAKRKWLVFLIGIAMTAYMLFKLKIGVG